MPSKNQPPPRSTLTSIGARSRSPYGFEMTESCLDCRHRDEYLFCNLPGIALEMLDQIRSTAVYPKGAMLFVEGQDSRGIFILCHGRVKLMTSSEQGKTVILRIADGGEVLGLSATISERPYEVTAETLEPCEANFISRKDFLNFLKQQGEAAVNVARELSNHYHCAYRDVRSLGLSRSAQAKIARLVLDWADSSPDPNTCHLRLTHEEISQLIGTSRETVTRVLSDLKKRKLLQIRGARCVLQNRQALETLAGS